MKTLETIETEHILYCKKCNGKIQAGPRWVRFCPTCEHVEEGFEVPHQVMSCTHCDQPLTIQTTEDDQIVGRCHTEHCGDCFSMQDLCLLQRPGVQVPKEKSAYELMLEIQTESQLAQLSHLMKRVFKAEVLNFKTSTETNIRCVIRFPSLCILKCGHKQSIVIRIKESGESNMYDENSNNELVPEVGNKKVFKNFKTLSELMNYLLPFTSLIEFPKPKNLKGILPIDLKRREQNLDEWHSILMKLVPYGVQVEDNRGEDDSLSLFCLTLPEKPVPKEIALKNEYHSDYHKDYYVSFYPDYDWSALYTEAIEYLKTIYKEYSLPNNQNQKPSPLG